MQFILFILDWQGKLPVPYGPYHIFCLVLTAVFTAVAIHYGRRHGERKIRLVLLLTSLLVANVLKKSIPFLRVSLIPHSVLAGGLILVLLGTKILLEHLGILA